MKNIAKYLPLMPPLLIGACTDTSERYRDTHALEMPPELVIERTHTQAPVAADESKTEAVSPLAGLVNYQDDDKNPVLSLKTRPDRAWDMVLVALKLGNIEVLDKNREINRIQVRFDPDTAGKKESLFDIFSDDNYAAANYNISLKEEVMGVVVKAELSAPSELEFGEDGSAEVIRFLHKVIDEKIINRDRNKVEE